MTYKNANRRDLNEPEIVATWEACGYYWLPMKPGQGFDGLLFTPHNIYVIEIKNPATLWTFTEAERAFAERIGALGHTYHVVESVDDALKLVGRFVE
jgi:hypothetical protein